MGFYAKRFGYKEPDIKAPRFRRTTLSVLDLSLFEKFQQENPNLQIDYKTYCKVVKAFNAKLRQSVIDNREGIELPEQMGWIFIGACPRKTKTPNPDQVESPKYDKLIQHKNWGSNQYVCKIFYSTYGVRYRYADSKLWYFRPSRIFKRSVSKAFKTNWNKYLKVSPKTKVSILLKKQGAKSIKVRKDGYNNRRVDFSDTQPS